MDTMKKWLLALTCVLLTSLSYAQNVYQIRADTVRIYNTCDTAELVLENATRDTLGFLFNKGNGRTEFRRLQLEKVGTSQLAIAGQDTVFLSSTRIVTTSTTLDDTYHTILCSGTGCGGPSGPLITITLPPASGILGREYTVKRIAAGCVAVRSAGGILEGMVGPNAVYLMNGSGANDWVTYISDGINWKVVNRSYVIPAPYQPTLNDVMARGSSTAYGINFQGDAGLDFNVPALRIFKQTGSGIISMSEDGGSNQAYIILSDIAGFDYSRVVIGANDEINGGGQLIIQGSGIPGGTRPVATFNGGIQAYGMQLFAREMTVSSYTTTTWDYTLLNKGVNPTITLTGDHGTIYVLVEEGPNPADSMTWSPGITYKGVTYTNRNNAALGNYSRFTVQNIGGTWYLIGAN